MADPTLDDHLGIRYRTLAAYMADLNVNGAPTPLPLLTPRASNEQMIDDTGLPLIRFYRPEHYRKPELFPNRWKPRSTAEQPTANSMSSIAKFLRSAPGLRAQLGEIQKHRVNRSHILAWAEDLRLVTWDEHGVDRTCNSTPAHPEDLFKCNCGWTERSSYPVLDEGENCACARLNSPLNTFLDEFRTTQAPGCPHFVAISYRWRYSDNSQGFAVNVQTNYNDQSRSALRTILCRSAKFAKHHGYRLMWIDQVGIEQENAVEKSIGIQAMDLVYERAALCLALLDYEVTTQEQLNDLEHALAEGINPVKQEAEWRKWVECLNVSELIRYAEAFRLVAEDEYFHRSWIAQENTVASITILLLRCNPALNKPEWMGSLKGEIQIPLCKFRMAAAKLEGALQGYIEKEAYYVQRHLEMIQYEQEYRGFPLNSPRGGRNFDKMLYGSNPKVVMDGFQARMEPLHKLENYMGEYRASQRDLSEHGRRKRSSAAEAIAFLATKHNFEIADRLAIIANLCGYEVRLDAQKLKNLGFDLAACVFCLAVLNGDFSLARLPEDLTYKDLNITQYDWEHITLQISHGADALDRIVEIDPGPILFSWAPRLVEGFTEGSRHRPDYTHYHTEFLGNRNPCLCIRGFLWHRYREIDFEHLRSTFQKRLPNASKHAHEASLQQKWSMPVEHYLDCFWEILVLLRNDQELCVLAEEMWLMFLNVKSFLEHSKTSRIPLNTAERSEANDDHQRKPISMISREEFHSQLQTTEGPLAYLGWMIQAIYMGEPLQVFRLDQQGEHRLEAHFAILNETYGETIFTPETSKLVSRKKLENIATSFGLPREQYSWIVKVSKTQGKASALEGLPERGIELDKMPRLEHKQPNDPVKGFWGKNILPKSCFVLL